VLVITLQQLVTTIGRYFCVTYVNICSCVIVCFVVESNVRWSQASCDLHFIHTVRWGRFLVRHKVCASESAKRSHMTWPTLGLSANWQRSIPLAECNRHQMRSYPLHGKRRNLRRRNGCCVRGHMSFWRAILKRSVLALLFSALWPEAPMLSSSFHSLMFCPGWRMFEK